ncbi:MAG: hypothetical protein IKT33_04390 [Clostridia bacterium]|nr:hypothetical protein [Clostridia bacterium]
MYNSFTSYITNQTSDFIITELDTWNNEIDLLSQYYQPYTGDMTTSTYHYHKIQHAWRKHYDLVLLIKK